MKTLFVLTSLIMAAVMLVGASASAVPDSSTSLADSGILDDDTMTCETEVSDSSPSATITITMYAVDDGQYSPGSCLEGA